MIHSNQRIFRNEGTFEPSVTPMSSESTITVAGHTDDQGSDASNVALSQGRANAVLEYLVKKGVDRARLTAKGYGEAKPIVPNTDDASRATNRRVEFVILARAEAAE